MTSKSILWVPLITQTIYNLPMPPYLFCDFRLRGVQCTVWCGSRNTSLHEAHEPRRVFDFDWLIGGLKSQIVVFLSGPCGFPPVQTQTILVHNLSLSYGGAECMGIVLTRQLQEPRYSISDIYQQKTANFFKHFVEGGSKHSPTGLKTSKSGVVLVPQPTNGPRDPLN